MADVRSLLKNERAARRIQHKHASYSTTGTLLCVVCHLQLKSESLWEGHLRSAGHIMRAEKLKETAKEQPIPEPASKKRKASDDEGEDTIRKRTKSANGLPEGFFDPGQEEFAPVQHPVEMQIPSRPATPLKTPDMIIPAKQPETQVDEDEWAAFEAEIATAEAQVKMDNDAIISAPAISAAELAKKSNEEQYAARKERQEAELEGDKEDAARKMEEELEEMESLEARVKRLREKREQLRKKESAVELAPVPVSVAVDMEEDEDDEDEDEDDDWDGFRIRG